jgi:hypothetical protein
VATWFARQKAERRRRPPPGLRAFALKRRRISCGLRA